MKLRIILALVFILSVQQWCQAQDLDPQNSVDPLESNPKIPVVVPKHPVFDDFWKGWEHLPLDLAHDQKDIWLFPLSVARGHNLKPTLAVIGITAGLVVVDRYPARYFRTTTTFKGFNNLFTGTRTAKANYMIPLGLYGLAFARRDSYAQKTFLLAGEAVLNSIVLTSVMKDTDRRWNPTDARPMGNYTDTWFKYKPIQNLGVGNGSMPSGHAITAFAVATVYAERYSKHRWCPLLAYGLASLDGFSRLTEQAHFTSDVFAGAVLGYVLARQAVFHAH